MKNENTYFENHTDDYAEQILNTQPVFYRNSAALINGYLKPGDVVLDIGNGGVINYNYKFLTCLDCADLVISEKAITKYKDKENVYFIQADVLDMSNIEDEKYDVVIIQAVIHHLAGKDLKTTYEHVERAINECARVLKSGGKLLVIESTVVSWFEKVERLLYTPMQLFFSLCRFGHVYQFSPEALRQQLNKCQKLKMITNLPVDVGPYIWIMGKRIPTKITPCGATLYVLEK